MELRYVLLLCFVLVMTGCDNVDSGDQVTGDTLCFSYFERCINPIFDQPLPTLSCTGNGGAACHNVAGGVGGTFKIHFNAQPSTSEMQGNFFSAKAFADLNNPSQSLLLRKPLANSDVNHGGGDIFPNTSDPNYQLISFWISNPVQDPMPVDANEHPLCATLNLGIGAC